MINNLTPKIKYILDSQLRKTKRRMIQFKRNASMKHSNSFNYAVQQNPHSITYMLTGNLDYYLEHGRKGGKRPPFNAIYKWIDDKHIAYKDEAEHRSIAFLISRKIAKSGTKLSSQNAQTIFSDFFNQVTKNQIRGCLVKEYENEISKQIKQVKL